MELDQKNIVLTGASRGLGKLIAQACWRHGANLLMVARSKEGLEALRDELQNAPVREKQAAFVCVADLSKENAALTVVNKALTHWTEAHALINAASIAGPAGPAWENDGREWESALRVNLFAPVELCRAFVPWLKATKSGSIINVSGGGAFNARPKSTAYATAEAGLVRFTEVLAIELKDSGVRANSIAPDLQHSGVEVNESAAAELCVFLAGDKSSFITGKLFNSASNTWQSLSNGSAELKDSDVYTMRRVLPPVERK
jgi:NAD(P)-dependent dehydrogenase (short-subunit alcohol dehydrogenase family)